MTEISNEKELFIFFIIRTSFDFKFRTFDHLNLDIVSDFGFRD